MTNLNEAEKAALVTEFYCWFYSTVLFSENCAMDWNVCSGLEVWLMRNTAK